MFRNKTDYNFKIVKDNDKSWHALLVANTPQPYAFPYITTICMLFHVIFS